MMVGTMAMAKAVMPRQPNITHGRNLSDNVAIILWISPKTGSSTMGFIYLDAHERHLQAPITTYFDSAGREVYTFPCPDFGGFIGANYLHTQDVLFITNLPLYIIPMG
jgi:hypothetical protein